MNNENWKVTLASFGAALGAATVGTGFYWIFGKIHHALEDISNELYETRVMNTCIKSELMDLNVSLNNRLSHSQMSLLTLANNSTKIKDVLEKHYAQVDEMTSEKNPKQIFQYTLECLVKDQKKDQAKSLYDAWQDAFPEDRLD